MGLLADAFSYGDSLKRKVGGLLADPMGTIELGINRLKEDNNNALNLAANAYPMAGNKTVLNTPAQKAAMQKQLADYASTVGIAGMFVGPKSQTWDKAAAAKAQELAKKGADPRKIWSETGTWKGPDGHWRQEINDLYGFKDLPDGDIAEVGARMLTGDRGSAGVLGSGLKKEATVRQIMDHPELFNAYPDIPKIRVTGSNESGASFGQHGISLNNSDLVALQNAKGLKELDGIRSPMLHEIQHSIQDVEGWARGGNVSDIPNILGDAIGETQRKANRLRSLAYRGDPLNQFDVVKPGALDKALEAESQIRKLRDWKGRVEAFPDSYGFDAYQNLAGEAEARATQARMNMDAAQRRATFPEDSYDVPLDSLILRGMGGY